MVFDPTLNYGEEGLLNQNHILWNYGEFIKTLIILSSKSDEQIDIMGYGCVTEEMADDFDTYFTTFSQSYIDNGLLTLTQADKLIALKIFFDEQVIHKSPDFWDDNKLDINAGWQSVRQQAKEILKALKMDNLKIEFYREEKHEMTETGKKLLTQTTKTRLVKQDV